MRSPNWTPKAFRSLNKSPKIDMPKPITYLNQTPTFEWFVVRCGFRMNTTKICIVISRLSTHPFKYASRSCAIFLTKIKVRTLLFEHVMHSHLPQIHDFLHLTFNVSLLTFHYNVSNEHRSSSYICPTSVWTSEQSNWSLMSKTVLCKASKPLKLATLLDPTNVSIG